MSKIYIPNHLKKLPIISNFSQMLEAYELQYPSRTISDYLVGNLEERLEKKKEDPVYYFIWNILITNKNYANLSLSYLDNLTTYLCKLFYCVKGTSKIFEYMKTKLFLSFYNEPIFKNGNLEFSLQETSEFPDNASTNFNTALWNFLKRLLYFKDLENTYEAVNIEIKKTFIQELDNNIITYRAFSVPYGGEKKLRRYSLHSLDYSSIFSSENNENTGKINIIYERGWWNELNAIYLVKTNISGNYIYEADDDSIGVILKKIDFSEFQEGDLIEYDFSNDNLSENDSISIVLEFYIDDYDFKTNQNPFYRKYYNRRFKNSNIVFQLSYRTLSVTTEYPYSFILSSRAICNQPLKIGNISDYNFSNINYYYSKIFINPELIGENSPRCYYDSRFYNDNSDSDYNYTAYPSNVIPEIQVFIITPDKIIDYSSIRSDQVEIIIKPLPNQENLSIFAVFYDIPGNTFEEAATWVENFMEGKEFHTYINSLADPTYVRFELSEKN